MALPPTGLTTLLDQAPTPAAMYDALAANDCLSAEGRRDRAQVVALLTRVVDEDAAREREGVRPPGPTTTDRMAAALMRSPYLGRHGQRLNRMDERDSSQPKRAWWQLWK